MIPKPSERSSTEETRELRRVFEEIHATRAWGPGESSSGPGSTRERVGTFLSEVIALVQELGVKTLLDAPCGDFNWAGPLADAVESYVGVDIVPELIESNLERHGSPRRSFLCRDLVHEVLPKADLVLCRDALVHLSTQATLAAVRNLKRSGARYLLATTFVGDHQNADIENGGWRPINLQRGPFGFPRPLRLIDERCDHSGGIYRDKRLGVWRFEDLEGLDWIGQT